MKVRFLGGTEGVGKSGIAVTTGGATVLLDYGVAVDHIPSFPMHIAPRALDAVILSHAHLDHSGASPLLHVGEGPPVYGVQPTLDLVEVLVKDFIRLSGYYLPYEFLDLRSMLARSVALRYRQKVKVKDVTVQIFDSGHIPGSCQILLDAQGSKLLYTGDINDVDTCLLKGADLDLGPVDAVIIESTYADEEHPERRGLEESFISSLREVVERGGIALVPAFSVGRSQEVLSVLAKYNFEYPVTVDGMAVQVNEFLSKHKAYLRDPELYERAIGLANWASGWKERKQVLKRPGVIVAPAGMLRGGLAVFYAERLANRAENAIFLVSFQIPGTPGRALLDTGKFIVGGRPRKVEAEVKRFDFSSHAGMSGLRRILKSLEGAPHVFVIHGERPQCHSLSSWARENGFKSTVPKVGEEYVV